MKICISEYTQSKCLLACHMKERICTVFGNRVLWTVFGTEREEVIGEGGRGGWSGGRRTSRAHRKPKAEQKCVRNLGP